MQTFAREFLDACGSLDGQGHCHALAWNVAWEFGVLLATGTYDGCPHAWNVLPDGSLFDGTSAQFGPDLDPALYVAGSERLVGR